MGRHIGMPHATRNKRVGLAEASAGARSGNAKAKAEQGSNPIDSTKGQREVFKTGLWSQEETEYLRRMYARHSASEIAEVLGRSFYSTESKARNLRLSKPSLCWLPQEDQVARSKYAEGWSPKRIGKLLSRPARGVTKRLMRLGVIRPKIVHPIGQERIDKDGIVWRKVSDTIGADLANWCRVDQIEWEQANGPVPDGFTLMIANKYLPRTPENLRLIRKDELWGTITGTLLPPEARELVQLKRQIEREAKKLSQK